MEAADASDRENVIQCEAVHCNDGALVSFVPRAGCKTRDEFGWDFRPDF